MFHGVLVLRDVDEHGVDPLLTRRRELTCARAKCGSRRHADSSSMGNEAASRDGVSAVESKSSNPVCLLLQRHVQAALASQTRREVVIRSTFHLQCTTPSLNSCRISACHQTIQGWCASHVLDNLILSSPSSDTRGPEP